MTREALPRYAVAVRSPHVEMLLHGGLVDRAGRLPPHAERARLLLLVLEPVADALGVERVVARQAA